MTHPDHLREKARRLRIDQRLSLDEIVERLGLPRTTIFLWIRDLPLGRAPNWTPAREKGTKAMQERFRRLRDDAYVRGEAEFATLAERPTFVDFVVLYIAEGSKRNRNRVSIANSDPSVMSLSTRWLRELTDRPLRFSVQHHADQDLDELRRFWGGLLDFPPEELALQRKTNSGELGGRHWRSRHGVLSITVGDTQLRARLQAWIDLVKAGWL